MLSWMEWNKNFLHSCKGSNKTPSKKDRIKLYRQYLKEEKDKMNSAPCVTVTSDWVSLAQYVSPPSHTHSLGTVEAAPCDSTYKCKYGWTANKQEGNNPMNYATATVQAGTTETQDQRKYLSQRLESIYYDLRSPLFAQFGLTDDPRPKTPKELKQRIADGKFIIKGIKDDDNDDEFAEDDYFYGSWESMIRWRDPAKKADSEGYEAATKELEDLRQKTMDIIKIKDPETGLKAIEDLESWKPTGAAN